MSCEFLSAAELQYMRDTQIAALVDRCTILRTTTVDDGYGGTITTTTPRENVPCRAWNKQTQDADPLAGAERTVYPFTFTFKWDEDIRDEDQILYAGITFDVKDINTPGTWVTALRVGAEAVKEGV